MHQNSEKWWLFEELLSENDFEAVLATFCCYDQGPIYSWLEVGIPILGTPNLGPQIQER